MTVSRINGRCLPGLLELLTCLGRQEFLLLDESGRIIYATAGAGSLFRRAGGELPGCSLSSLLGESLSAALLCGRGGKVEDWLLMEHKIHKGGNETLNLQLACLPYQDEERGGKGFLLSITPLPSRENKRLSSMGEITASIAHEIRNPLAGILTTTETLREDFASNDPRREYLERIITEINRVNLFLVKFLALARPQKPQFVLASLLDVLEHVLLLEHREIERGNIQVVRDYEKDFPLMMIDQHQIEQVILNLVLNAIQAMPKGGTLGVKLESGRENGQPCAYLQVSDSGVGISPRNMRKIFLPFFSTKPKGVGLGLSVSRQILKEHGGELRVRSKPGEGTTFTLILPRHPGGKGEKGKGGEG